MITILAFSLLAGLVTGAGASAQPVTAELGAVVLEDGAGERLVLGELVEGPTILHFWATWCAPCREELPGLEAFAEAEGLGERLVLVSVDTAEYARVGEFLDELGLGLESWRQVEGNVGSAFAILGYPSTVVVDGAGEVLWRRQGAVDWGDADEAGEVMGSLTSAQ